MYFSIHSDMSMRMSRCTIQCTLRPPRGWERMMRSAPPGLFQRLWLWYCCQRRFSRHEVDSSSSQLCHSEWKVHKRLNVRSARRSQMEEHRDERMTGEGLKWHIQASTRGAVCLSDLKKPHCGTAKSLCGSLKSRLYSRSVALR